VWPRYLVELQRYSELHTVSPKKKKKGEEKQKKKEASLISMDPSWLGRQGKGKEKREK